MPPKKQGALPGATIPLNPAAALMPSPIPTPYKVTATTSKAAPTPLPASNTGTSVVDYLKSTGQASDYASRSALATKYGITGYTGTADQNTSLMKMLQSGAAAPPPTDLSNYVNPNAAPYQSPSQTVSGQPPAPAAADLQQFADTANAEASALYEQTKNRDIDMRESTKLINSLAEKLVTTEAPPKPPSMADQFKQLRTELGLDPLEAEMAELDAEADRIRTTALVAGDKIDDRSISREAQSLRKGQVAKDAQRELAFLDTRRSAVGRQLNNKIATVEMMMDFAQTDYENTTAYYSQQFNRNLQMLDLFTTLEDREIAADDRELEIQDREKKNTQANLTTMYNALTETNTPISSLSESQRRQIKEMSLQVGLPGDFFESLQQNAPEMDILSTTTRDSGTGKYADVLMRDPKTGKISSESVYLGSIAGKATGGGSSGTGGTRGTGGVGGMSGDIEGAITLALDGIKFPTVAQDKEASSIMASLLSEGKIEEAKEQLGIYVRNYGANAAQQDQYDGRSTAIRVLEGIQSDLDAFVASGGNTNVFTGLSEKALRKVGSTVNPKLAGLANKIALGIIDYRKAVSGSAFTESEKSAYDAVFPSVGNTPTLNKALIGSLISQFEIGQENFIRQRIGANKYDTIFDPANDTSWQEEDKFLKDFDSEVDKNSKKLLSVVGKSSIPGSLFNPFFKF